MSEQKKHNFSCIILAAGKGTRMKSNLPKVMHKLAGTPLISHVITAVSALSPEKIVTVVAPGMESVQEEAKKYCDIKFAIQTEQLGTGHAVNATKSEFTGYHDKILILCGDTPLITSETLDELLEVSISADIVVLGMRVPNSFGYGRLVIDSEGQLEEIVEERDATDAQKKITLCNSGILAVSGKYLFELLDKLDQNNNSGEYYLTDIVAHADEMDLHCRVAEADVSQLIGINSREQLSVAENMMQWKLRLRANNNGVTLIDPATTYLCADTKIENDVVIHPHVVFGAGVTVETGVEIKAFSHIEGATIKANAIVGPFARLRPGSTIGENAHIGNFVEIKNSKLEKGAKANHLSYIGDSEIGEAANIGAGTITCNYDGLHKYKTTIGANAFIGSNSALVAPVNIGAGAIVGAGSVITQDIPADNLGIERGTQVNKQRKPK